MTTSSDTPDTTQQTRRPKRVWLTIVVTLTLIALVAVYLLGYALGSTKPVVASAAKTDSTTIFGAPKCADGEISVTVRPNETTWSAGVQATAKTTFDSNTGLAGDILVDSSMAASDSDIRAFEITKVYAWQPESLDSSTSKASWSVTRYIVPTPTTELQIKSSGLSAAARLIVCGLR